MPTDTSPEAAVFPLLNGMLRQRRILFGLPVIAMAAVVVWRFSVPRMYTSKASFSPQVRETPAAGLSGLAAQFGLGFGLDGTESPAFYADLARSRPILGVLADTTFALPGDQGAQVVTMASALDISKRTPALQRDAVIRRLEELVRTEADVKTGVVSLSVRMPARELSFQAARTILAELNRFNMERRQSRAGAERQFVEARRADAQRELSAAEDQLQQFLLRNRDYRNSPTLTFGQERLQREVQLRQALLTQLSQAFDRARMEEVRNTAVITIIAPPEVPARADPRGALRDGLLAGLMTLLACGLVLAALGTIRRARELEPTAAADFDIVVQSFRRDPLGWRRRA